jgi:dTMP kinase
MLIAVEGVDGVGKATAAALLRELLTHRGHSLQSVAFPRYAVRPFGPLIRDALRHPARSAVDSRRNAILFALDRVDWVARSYAAKQPSEWLLVDRWTSSNVAYLVAHTGCWADADWVIDLEHGRLGLPRPQLTVLVQGDLSLAADRVRKRSKTEPGRSPDAFEQEIRIQVLAAEAYGRLVSDPKYGRWVSVTNTGTRLELRRQLELLVVDVLQLVE